MPHATRVVRAYDASTGARLWGRRHDGPGHGVDLGVSPDGARVFVTGSDYATVAYDASTGTRLWATRYDDGDTPSALVVGPDGSSVFVTGSSVGPPSTQDYATVAFSTT
jgi:outer membrane protein assembly factor BamB